MTVINTENSKNPMPKDHPEMTAKDVIEIVQLFNQNHIDLYLDGGWGVDALLGEQTRIHADLDIAVQHKDVPQIRALLEARGYKDVPRDDTRDCNFVLGDDRGHQIDIHSYTFDAAGKHIYGVAYPIDSLTGEGSVNGQPVKCISPEWMVKFHTGYKLDENDYQDVKALCQRFVIKMPSEYKEFDIKRSKILVKPAQNSSKELPMILFEGQKEWAAWLEENHAASSGVWLRIAKKASGLSSVSYDEAVEVALCYGWIDGQKKSYDESSWLQKFTPRGRKSIWSKINRGKAEALIEKGQMKPAGLRAIEQAKQDGRWDAAYDSHSTATVPGDFQAELDKNPAAQAFFDTLNSQNRYAILFRIQTAKKAETRAKRIEQFIHMLENQEKLYP